MTQPTLRQRLRGLAATLLLLLIVAGVPFLLLAIGSAPWHVDLGELRAMLSGPDDGTLAMLAITVVAWVAWAIVALSVALEIISQVRGLPAPTLPGLGTPQRAVGRLVAVAALLFIATPTVVAAFPAAPAHASSAAQLIEMPPSAPVEASPVLPEAAALHPKAVHAPAAATSSQARSTIDYTVKRGDSLWKIADRLLGDGARFPEIVELNSSLLNGRPDFIIAGTVLKVPHHTAESDSSEATDAYVVKPGDTLSEIAEARLGDPSRYPELFEASRDTVQADGAMLTDPDLIRPGWQITVPGQRDESPGQPEQRHESPGDPLTEEKPTPGAASADQVPTDGPTHTWAEPSPEPGPEPHTPTPVEADANADTDIDTADMEVEDDASAPAWVMPGLSGAGVILAALVLLAIRAHRNTQLRYRRPGQSIAPPPDDLRAVEKTAFTTGGPLTATIEQLDRALNHLAGECADAGLTLPQVITATLAKGAVTLHLAQDADLPEPWTGTGHEWSLHLDQSLPDRQDVLPPYPMLVTVGRDDSGVRLLNLEHLGIAALSGDSDRATALARHIAAELALNPWSTLVEVTIIGFGAELAPLDTMRLDHHPDGDQVVSVIARQISESLKIGWGDPDPYRVILTTGAGSDEIAPLLTPPAPWVGAALVSLSAPVPGSTEIEIDRDGRLSAPLLGVDLQAAGLTSEEARACAALVDLTRESEPVKIPQLVEPATGWRALADQAGALREELTDVRRHDPAGDNSLLPQATEDYVESAATTAEDIEALAPAVPEHVHRTVQEADPTLDEDLAAWFDADSRRPRLTLLGAVNAKAFGELKPVITKRKPYFVEILAYLALHPKGVTASDVADAFGIAASRARTDISSLRSWLGTDPGTKQPYLPAANESAAFLESGVKAYQLQDVLVDLDLFRRLRVRGQARGADGIDDLKTAISLVTGPPFSMLREKGWSWLLDTERIHETTGCAIVDTAHIVVVDALAKGDLPLARQIAEAACHAAPYDEISRLDLIKVTDAEGHGEAADTMLNEDIFNRTDDYLPPIELPKRSREIVGKQDWVDTRRRRRERRA